MAGTGVVFSILHLIVLALSFLVLQSDMKTASVIALTTEADALLEFKSTLLAHGGEAALRSWTPGSHPCSENHSTWKGVLCSNGNVWGLQLESMGLSGQLNVTSLASLASLRAISFMNNNFVGPMPEITKLGALKSLFISNNQFSGEIPDNVFAGTRSLKKVFMSNNEFSGKIPSSLTQLSKLMFLRLDANGFEGEIPDFQQPGLRLLNVSYNKLEGRIPASISKMDQSLFAGNKNLCGSPVEVSCPSPPSKRKSHALIIGIIISSIVALLILCCIISTHRRRQTGESAPPAAATTSNNIASSSAHALAVDKVEQNSAANHDNNTRRGSREVGEHWKLSFIKEEKSVERFEMQDLLKASAEVLGSGNFGSSYKAVIVNGPSVVVKRFKQMNRFGREDFQEHMRRLGRLSHPNILPLVAYYYRKEEKLIITNFIINGSLAHMLHGNRGSNLPPLEWPTRLKIIKGVARGLAYLYEELPMLTLPHGHLKSSNVLINDDYEPLLTDYALVPLVNQSHASEVMVAYKSPEVTETGKPSKKSDVWSLGILILEVLTGKFPATYLQKGKGNNDLVGWVNSVVEVNIEGEAFDSEMKGTENGEGEMLKMMQIGLNCCNANVDKRWEMKEALRKIDELEGELCNSNQINE